MSTKKIFKKTRKLLKSFNGLHLVSLSCILILMAMFGSKLTDTGGKGFYMIYFVSGWVWASISLLTKNKFIASLIDDWKEMDPESHLLVIIFSLIGIFTFEEIFNYLSLRYGWIKKKE